MTGDRLMADVTGCNCESMDGRFGAHRPECPVAQEQLLQAIAATLGELYEPAGVLMFWSARIKYLDDRRPCDLWAERDMDGLDTLWRRLEAMADGVFL